MPVTNSKGYVFVAALAPVTRRITDLLARAKVFIAVLTMLAVASSAAASVVGLKTVSTRADRVSGGDVLVQITLDSAAPTTITLNGVDVSSAFLPGPAANTLLGLVTGLKNGANTLIAGGQSLAITNYPITGPIFSGPHETPYICTTTSYQIYGGLLGLQIPDSTTYGEPPLDADCSALTKISYLYLPTGATLLQALPSTTTLPSDVSKTTTTTGQTVNFIVRIETSTIDRGIYQSAILHDPTSDPSPTWFAPPKGWNKRLIGIEGAGCPGGWYFQGTAGGSIALPGTLDFNLLSTSRLGEGYAIFGNTLQNASQNCNAVLESEAALMSKEHFIETYGPPVYTVTEGCSGGSYGSLQPADMLPGLFDGALIACTFPDPLGIAFSGSDGHLLTHYFTFLNPSGFTADQQVAVSGYKGTQAWIDAANQSGRTDPVPGRVDIAGYSSATFSPVVPLSLQYDPVSNRHGARGDIYDHGRNIYGVDGNTGFALRPFDNVGVQYGLQAMNAGTISPEQFVQLNEGIGGYDQDANYVTNRVVGDVRAMKRSQLGGMQLGGNGGLASIPVFDFSGIYNDDGGYHYQWFHFAARERMLQANGDTANHVMWRGNPVPFDTTWALFIQWVEAVAADTSALPQRTKVINHKPASAVDGCWSDPTTFIAEPQVFGRAPTTRCNTLFPSYAFPRYVAGGPLAANVMKCGLKPIIATDYAVSFTPDQIARLQKVFPLGVCDWPHSSGNHAGVTPYVSFGPAPENLIPPLPF